jgi:hypothetical protein
MNKDRSFTKYIIELAKKNNLDVNIDVISNQRVLSFYIIDENSSYVIVDDLFLNTLKYNNISFIRFKIIDYKYYIVYPNGILEINNVSTEKDFKNYIRVEKLKEILS